MRHLQIEEADQILEVDVAQGVMRRPLHQQPAMAVAEAIQREDGGLVARAVEGRGGVAKMVLDLMLPGLRKQLGERSQDLIE
ncbi:MAG: hypothetical protein U1E17_06135 [Geminicoccaceae bacterium]